jgi:hypothetical protein
MPTDILVQNLVSPITLAFLLGMVATFIRSDLEISEPVIKIFANYLLFSIGLQGGQELAAVKLGDIASGLAVTFALIVLLPGIAFLLARFAVGLDTRNAAGVAALYGSVSSVTFAVSQTLAKGMGTEMAGYVAGLVALMELGILVALFIGRLLLAGQNGARANVGAILLETMRGRGLVLLAGGLLIGAAIGQANFKRIEPFFVDLFRGVLVLFILEMGMAAAQQMKDFAIAGPRMLAFAILLPLLNGFIATFLATAAGLPLGSAFVVGAVAASASYIDAPAAVRATFPEANPGIYLTASLGITFPFMLIAGIPIVYEMARFWAGILN